MYWGYNGEEEVLMIEKSIYSSPLIWSKRLACGENLLLLGGASSTQKERWGGKVWERPKKGQLEKPFGATSLNKKKIAISWIPMERLARGGGKMGLWSGGCEGQHCPDPCGGMY